MLDVLEEIRLRWIEEREEYDRFRVVLAEVASQTLRSMGISARITSRLKEIDSLVRKAAKQLKDGRQPSFNSITDKVGVRAVVRYKEEVGEAAAALQVAFKCTKVEVKSEGTKINEFGYQSCHLDVNLPQNHPDYSLFGSFPAELQVRTLAQDLWADMAHELSYKSVMRESAPELQTEIDRRIYILSALVESADMEFSRINREMMSSPGAEALLLLRTLEREYFKFTTRSYDPEFAVASIGVLTAVNPRPLRVARAEIAQFSGEFKERLTHIFSDQVGNQDRSIFLPRQSRKSGHRLSPQNRP